MNETTTKQLTYLDKVGMLNFSRGVLTDGEYERYKFYLSQVGQSGETNEAATLLAIKPLHDKVMKAWKRQMLDALSKGTAPTPPLR